jgi:hypothetical protein
VPLELYMAGVNPAIVPHSLQQADLWGAG